MGLNLEQQVEVEVKTYKDGEHYMEVVFSVAYFPNTQNFEKERNDALKKLKEAAKAWL